MKIEGIDHIVIAVKDMDRAVEFFSQLFQTSFEDLGIVEEIGGVRSKVCPEGIELLSPVAPGSALAGFLDKRGDGLYAIAVKVKNAQKAASDARKRGVRVVGRIEKKQLGTRVFNLREIILHPKDAYGVQLLLTESETKEKKNKR